MPKANITFKNQAGAAPEILIYGYIGEGGWYDETGSVDVAYHLKALGDVSEINVRINSNGGEVFAGIAMYNMLRRHSAKINVYVDGIAASIASIIAMSGDRRIMPVGSMMMVHNPLTWVGGNADELRETADVLDQVRDALVPIYTERTGLDAAKVIELLNAETYMTAADALSLGFATEIESSVQIAACLSREKMVINGLELSPEKFKNMPDAFLTKAQPVLTAAVPQASNTGVAGKTNTKEQEPMDLETLKASHPEIFKAAMAEGVQAERERIQDIEDLTEPGFEAMAKAAKFENHATSGEFLKSVIAAKREKGQQYLATRTAATATIAAVEPTTTEATTVQAAADEKTAQKVNKITAARNKKLNNMRGA